MGRLYEDPHSPPVYCWFWSITVYVDSAHGITTSGRVGKHGAGQSAFPCELGKMLRRFDSA